MQIAKVLGTVTATVRHSSLAGSKLLLVQPLLSDGRQSDGHPVVAADGVGAGRGDRVMMTSDGRFARELLKSDRTPLRWTIIGICDQ